MCNILMSVRRRGVVLIIGTFKYYNNAAKFTNTIQKQYLFYKQSSKLKSNLKVIYRSCKNTSIQDVVTQTLTKLNNLTLQLICALKSVKKKVKVEDIILVWILPFRSLRQSIEFTGVGDDGACSAS